MNNQDILFETLHRGAYKVPAVVSERELQRLQSKPTYWERVNMIAPQLGSYITDLLLLTPQPYPTSVSVETPQPHQRALHTDSPLVYGLSFLIPLNGPEADFYFASEELSVDSGLHKASHFAYGPGDMAIIRQQVEYHTGEKYCVKPQIYHTGIAAEPRDLLICDVLIDDTIWLNNIPAGVSNED